MAAQIYAAHIIHGEVTDEEKISWMERSIREAVRIAKTVEASIATHDEAPTVADSSEAHADSKTSTAKASTPQTPTEQPMPTESRMPTESAASFIARQALEDESSDPLTEEDDSTYLTEE
jgi:hypothetical protein